MGFQNVVEVVDHESRPDRCRGRGLTRVAVPAPQLGGRGALGGVQRLAVKGRKQRRDDGLGRRVHLGVLQLLGLLQGDLVPGQAGLDRRFAETRVEVGGRAAPVVRVARAHLDVVRGGGDSARRIVGGGHGGRGDGADDVGRAGAGQRQPRLAGLDLRCDAGADDADVSLGVGVAEVERRHDPGAERGAELAEVRRACHLEHGVQVIGRQRPGPPHRRRLARTGSAPARAP